MFFMTNQTYHPTMGVTTNGNIHSQSGHPHAQPNKDAIYVTQEMQRMEALIREVENMRIICETQIGNCHQQYQEKEQQLSALGTNPQTAEEELLNLENAIRKDIQEFNELMNPEVIQKIKTELNKPIENNEINLDFKVIF